MFLVTSFLSNYFIGFENVFVFNLPVTYISNMVILFYFFWLGLKIEISLWLIMYM